VSAASLSRPLALALLVAVPAGAQEQTRYTLSGSSVAVYNLVGSLRAVAGSGREVVVTVERRGPAAAQLRVETGAIRGRETLRVVYPGDRILYRGRGDGSFNTQVNVDDDGTFYDDGRGDDGRRVRISSRSGGLEAHADLTVAVPAGQRIALHLAAGEVHVTNVNGEILVDVGAADVTTSGTRGQLRLDTGSGEVSVTNAEGDLDLDSGSGASTLTGVRGRLLNIDSGSGSVTGRDITVQELRVDAGSGAVELERVAAPDIVMDLGSGSTDLSLTSDVQSLTVDSGSGSVTIRVPESLGAQVEVDAGSGGLDLQIPVTTRRMSRDAFSGSIGDGQGRIVIDAGSGRVRILRG
jgi:lia operon protein LiaG